VRAASGRFVKPGRALLFGAATVATVEALETSAFWWWLRGITPAQIFRYIASGFLGQSAFEDGSSSLWLGVAIHFFNALVIVAAYFVASRRFSALIRHPVAWGLAYGACVHLFMAFVVVPLSAARNSGVVEPLLLLHSLASQAVTVGLPSALFARAGRVQASPLPPSSSEFRRPPLGAHS
jgi:hypothetical protein